VAAQDDTGAGAGYAEPAAADELHAGATDGGTGAEGAGAGEAVEGTAVVGVEEEPPGDGATPGGMEVKLPTRESTYVASGQAGSNFGGAGRLRVGYSLGDKQGAMRSLVRFNLGSIPGGSQILKAEIELHVNSSEPSADPIANMDVAVMAVEAHRNWSQGGATWNNANNAGGSPSAHGNLPLQGSAKINVTELVKYWFSGGANNGLLIMGDETVARGRVRNLSAQPMLTVVYRCDTLPPVTSLVALPGTSPRKFTVHWHGEDKAPSGCTPSGINKFRVEFNVDNSGWQLWTEQASGTKSHDFNRDVPNGAMVAFRIHADDKAGNMEKTPGSAQASTRVISKAPTVVFTALPQWTHAANINLSWGATDAPLGVSSYDVQYQVNNDGVWHDLLVQTQQTATVFPNAQNESVYSFRARARDSIGNEGSYPRTPQAQTTVVLYPVAKMGAFSPNVLHSTAPITTSFTLSWSGKETPDTTITKYQIQYQVLDFAGRIVQPWKAFGEYGGTVTSATFPIELGDGIYQFEATATDSMGHSTPFAAKAEATMVVDLADTVQPREFLPIVSAP
jgi:hypothetical protein